MSLNDLTLTAPLLAGLYENCLVPAGKQAAQLPEPPIAAGPAADSGQVLPYKFIGGNARKVLLLVNDPEHAFLPDDQLMLITRMLEACQLHLGDVALVNHGTRAADMGILRQQLEPARVLLFGVDPVEVGLPLRFAEFREQTFDGIPYLLLPAISNWAGQDEQSRIVKSKLWVSLRHMFGI